MLKKGLVNILKWIHYISMSCGLLATIAFFTEFVFFDTGNMFLAAIAMLITFSIGGLTIKYT